MTSKWRKGGKIESQIEACEAIINGEVLFHNHKPQNSGWLQNWNISQIRREVMSGRLFHAMPNTEESQ